VSPEVLERVRVLEKKPAARPANDVRRVVHEGIEQMAASYTAAVAGPPDGGDDWSGCPHCAARKERERLKKQRQRLGL
jgi:hypothetical protein